MDAAGHSEDAPENVLHVKGMRIRRGYSLTTSIGCGEDAVSTVQTLSLCLRDWCNGSDCGRGAECCRRHVSDAWTVLGCRGERRGGGGRLGGEGRGHLVVAATFVYRSPNAPARVGVTTPFCVTRRPIDKTSPTNLHIGGASVACSGITINLSALHIVNARQRFVSQQNVRYSAKLIHFRQND